MNDNIKLEPQTIKTLDKYIGKTFGKLFVLKHGGYKIDAKGIKHSLMVCRCECGNIKNLRMSSLRDGAFSCGCLNGQSSRLANCGDLSGSFWSVIKSVAKLRDIEFNISIEYAWQLFEKQCRKCAITHMPLTLDPNYHRKNKKEQTASLDRIDSNIGYIEDNVQWVHKQVNIIKFTLSNAELKYWAELVLKHYGTNN